MPDWLEPALDSYHRGLFHSVVAGAIAGTLTGKALVQAAIRPIQQLRAKAKADELLELSRAELDPIRSFLLFVAACATRTAAGAISGFVAGYSSHLILDAATPRSVPLLVQGL